MGYYVTLKRSSVIIDQSVKTRVYDLWCRMNDPVNDCYKRGSGYQNGKKVAKWYSWMSEHYDQECKTVEEILDMLGFGYETLADGSVHIMSYDNKTGQEDLFFRAVAHLLTGEMEWVGEDGETWTWQLWGEPEVLSLQGTQTNNQLRIGE